MQSFVVIRYGPTTYRVENFLPDNRYTWGGIERPGGATDRRRHRRRPDRVLWAFTKYTRVGLAITASAQNERAVATLGWSPERLSMLTWTIGGALAGLAGILVAPFTGLTPEIFTLVVTISALAAALLGGFESFPLTLLGGLLLGVGESLMTNYQSDVQDVAAPRLAHRSDPGGAVPGHPVGARRAREGAAAAQPCQRRAAEARHRRHQLARHHHRVGITIAVSLFWLDDNWATAMYISLAAAIFVASIILLTGLAGQLSLAQWAIGGIGALIAGRFVEAGVPIELAILLGILLTIPAGLSWPFPRCEPVASTSRSSPSVWASPCHR